MNDNNQPIRLILITLFILTSLLAIGAFTYIIWANTQRESWGKSGITINNLMWKWKGFLVIAIYSIIAVIGLVKKSKIGIILGSTIPVGIFIYFLIDFKRYGWISEESISFINFISSILFVFLPIFMFYGLTKLKRALSYSKRFKITDYLITGALTTLMILSFYFGFN